MPAEALRLFAVAAFNNKLVCTVVLLSGLVTESGLAPRGNRSGTADGGLTFTASVWVVAGVHDRTADCRSDTQMTGLACFTEAYVLVVDIGYLTDRSHAVSGDLSHFARGKSNENVFVLLTHELSHISCGTHKLRALAGIKLDVVNESTYGDIAERQRIAGLDVRMGTACNGVANSQTVGSDDISLLAVLILNESDKRASVRIVLKSENSSVHALLISLEVDYSVFSSASAASVTNGYSAVAVSACGLFEGSKKALLGIDLGKAAVIGNSHLTS